MKEKKSNYDVKLDIDLGSDIGLDSRTWRLGSGAIKIKVKTTIFKVRA